jgi:hypothetical protein
MSDDWTTRAKEPFFKLISKKDYQHNQINSSKVRCGPSALVPGQLGVFSNTEIKKGEVVEWGIASIVPGMNVQENDLFFAWDSVGKITAATVSGCALYYNTLGDASNTRCVPYHSEMRFEIYALRDIAKNEELTFRYDSMNYRKGMEHLIPIVGKLKK